MSKVARAIVANVSLEEPSSKRARLPIPLCCDETIISLPGRAASQDCCTTLLEPMEPSEAPQKPQRASQDAIDMVNIEQSEPKAATVPAKMMMPEQPSRAAETLEAETLEQMLEDETQTLGRF